MLKSDVLTVIYISETDLNRLNLGISDVSSSTTVALFLFKSFIGFSKSYISNGSYNS